MYLVVSDNRFLVPTDIQYWKDETYLVSTNEKAYAIPSKDIFEVDEHDFIRIVSEATYGHQFRNIEMRDLSPQKNNISFHVAPGGLVYKRLFRKTVASLFIIPPDFGNVTKPVIFDNQLDNTIYIAHTKLNNELASTYTEILKVLDDASQPLTTREIAIKMGKGDKIPNTCSRMTELRDKGLVKADKNGLILRWKIVR